MRIYVGNIPFKTTADDLRAVFAAHGEVEEIQIPQDDEAGRHKGFAFIDMSPDEGAYKAIAALDRTQFQGRTIHCGRAFRQGRRDT